MIINSFVADLIAGSPGSAFHGLIQTGWAISSGDAESIAQGLAYFTMVSVHFFELTLY
jgi:hypothetical protein